MRISLNDAVKRAEAKEQGKNTFREGFKNVKNFSLSDGEKAVIQILVNDAAEIPVVRTHTVQLYTKAGKQYFVEVSCTADEGHCPFCEAKKAAGKDGLQNVSFAHDKLIVPVAVLERNGEKETTYALFTRGTNFYMNTLSGYIASLGIEDPIEISRNGQGVSTTYTLFPPVDVDAYKTGKNLEEMRKDLNVEDDDVVGRVDSAVKTWNAEQMNFYLETKQNPTKANMGETEQQETPTINRRVSSHGF